MEIKDRVTSLIRSLPPAQRAGILVAVAVLAMAAVPFLGWITTPTYSLLYAGLDDQALAQTTTELDAAGVDYRIDGSRVSVPQDQVHQLRARLAEAGVSSAPDVPGYELLDEQTLGVSDFRQRVDLQRAVEGELTRTLTAMDAVDAATVRLVLPEDRLFSEEQTDASASVLLDVRGTPAREQIEAVTFLIAAAVDGLEPEQVTVADTRGRVLHSPGSGTTSAVADDNHRRTRDFEQALAADLTGLLHRATDAPASAVVRATLDYDRVEQHTEVYDDEGTALRETTTEERYEGNAPLPGGTVGVDGGPEPGLGGEGTYERDDATRDFGVDRTTTSSVRAPGRVEALQVAVVVDENTPLGDAELTELVAAAAGADVERGDRIAITRVPTPVAEEAVELESGPSTLELVQRAVALVVLLMVALGLFLMSRRRTSVEDRVVPATLTPTPEIAVEESTEQHRGVSVRDEVSELVERQPEEIAVLLRSWLADRRGPA